VKKENSIEYRHFVLSMVPPAVILFLIWLCWIFTWIDGTDLFFLGIFPRNISGAAGILAAPFIHANFNHLINNTVPFFFLLTATFYFYQKVAWKVLLIAWIIPGILVWLFARPAYHIGASGQVYCFASFVFFSGIVRRNINLLAISMLVIFLYGSMVWGIFPYRPDMSWESHLMGLTVGMVMAVAYRHEGPGPTKFIQDMEEEGESESESESESGSEERL